MVSCQFSTQDVSRIKDPRYRNIVIFGCNSRSLEILQSAQKMLPSGTLIVGFIAHEPFIDSAVLHNKNQMSLAEQLVKNHVDEILISSNCLGNLPEATSFAIFKSLQTLGINLRVVPLEKDLRPHSSKILGAQTLKPWSLSLARKPRVTLAFKRFLDVCISASALLVLAPVFCVLALLIKATSKGPCFYADLRAGLRGKPFRMYKFRTMVSNAEALKSTLMGFNEMERNGFKLTHDPRVTKVGRILRKTSIDEFPQFWNVFKGDMSLVGPRPIVLPEFALLTVEQVKRVAMRPGLSCIWQVSGRNNIRSFDEWMKLDIDYVEQFSLMLDFKIFMRTFFTVMFCIGAK